MECLHTRYRPNINNTFFLSCLSAEVRLILLFRLCPKGFRGWHPKPLQTPSLHRGSSPSKQQLLASNKHPQPIQWTAAGNLEPLLSLLVTFAWFMWVYWFNMYALVAYSRLLRCTPVAGIYIWSFPQVNKEALENYGFVFFVFFVPVILIKL